MERLAYVWVFGQDRKILVTDDPGPPVRATGFLGFYPMPDGPGWGNAETMARRVAAERGFRVEYDAPLSGISPEEPE